MMPVDFEGTNIVLNKPSTMTDEECMSGVPARFGVDSVGFAYMLTAWMPSKEDLEALNAGRPLYLKVLGKGFPPACLFTMNANEEVNV